MEKDNANKSSARKEKRHKWWSANKNNAPNREEKREGLRKNPATIAQNKPPTVQNKTENKSGFKRSQAVQISKQTSSASMKVEMKSQTKLNFKKVKKATDIKTKTPNNKNNNQKKEKVATSSASPAKPTSKIAGEMPPSVHANRSYVLFIGNLPFNITKDELMEHFRKTGGVNTIRIPTDKTTGKCKGFAYIEFRDRISHGIALRLHQTTINGRKINVEYTSIGGKNKKRLDKLKMKNLARSNFKRPLEW